MITPSAPWIIALVVLLIGIALWWLSRRTSVSMGRWILRIPAVLAVVLGMAMFVGAAINASKVASIKADHPPLGIMVDLDGTAIHVWCEGETNDMPAIVLMPGGYSQGLWMRHLQIELSADYRTCLVDRPGLGYSDSRPLPNSMERVINEVHEALKAAGEQFPVIMAGHSYGGFFAANFSAIYPGDVAGLILLDPTAPSHQLAKWSNDCPGPGYFNAFASMYGLAFIKSLNPMYGPHFADVREAVGEDWDTVVAFEIRPSALLGTHSAFDAVCRNPLSTIPPAEGRLGDVPLLLINQDLDPVEERPDWLKHLSDFEYANHQAWYRSAGTDYLRMSGRSSHVYAPKGAGHNFPHTEPEFTLEVMRKFLEELDAESMQSIR